MQITLSRIEGARFSATDERGNTTIIDTPEIVGGSNAGFRPMEMLLMGLAGCTAMDVLVILQKSGHDVATLDVRVIANRVEAVPAVFSDIHIVFEASGSFNERQLARSASLSLDKYCPVAAMLRPGVQITHETVKKSPSLPSGTID